VESARRHLGRQHEQTVVIAGSLGRYFRPAAQQEVPGNPGRVEQVEADVAETGRAVGFEKITGDADAEHCQPPSFSLWQTPLGTIVAAEELADGRGGTSPHPGERV